MKKPRILVIENAVALTGGLESIARSSKGLKETYEFTFVVPQGSLAKNYLTSLDFEVYELPMVEIRKDIFTAISYLPILLINTIRLFGLVNRLKASLIVSNDLYNLMPPLFKFFGGKRPYVVYVRFLPSKFPKILMGFWCFWNKAYSFATIAVSHAVKNELSYHRGVVCIGGELPAQNFPYAPPASKRILYPANYIRGKGQEYALQSWAMISKKHPQWKLRFVGGDMGLEKNKVFKTELIEMSKKLLLTNSVEWCDFSERIEDEYLMAAFVLNFSESESFSMTCLEAMFYGRPVVATRSGGPSEIIDHDVSGILVDIKDVKAMAHAMDVLISDTETREAMARKAFESVRIKFSYANTIARVGEVYRQALSNSPARIS